MRRLTRWIAAVPLVAVALVPTVARAAPLVAVCTANGVAVATPVSPELPGAYTWSLSASGTCATAGPTLRTMTLGGRSYSPGSGNPYAGLRPFPGWFKIGITITNPKNGVTSNIYRFLNLTPAVDVKAAGAYVALLYEIDPSRYGDTPGLVDGAGALIHKARTQSGGVYTFPITILFAVTSPPA